MKLKFRILSFLFCIALLIGSMCVFTVSAGTTDMTLININKAGASGATGVTYNGERLFISLQSNAMLPGSAWAIEWTQALLVDGVEKTGIAKKESDYGYFLDMATADLPNDGQAHTLIFKAGSYTANTGDVVNLTADFKLLTDGTNWSVGHVMSADAPVILYMDVRAALGQSANNFHLITPDGTNAVLHVDGSWNDRFFPADTVSGAYFTHGGTTTRFQIGGEQGMACHDGGAPTFYIESFPQTPVAGDTLTLKGDWYSTYNGGNEFSLYAPVVFTFDGTGWARTSDIPTPEKVYHNNFTGTLTTLNAGAAGNAYQMYLVGSESLAAVFASADWSDRLVPADDENSGLFLNGVKLPNNGINQGLLLKHDGANNGWFVDWDSARSAKAGDILTIKGVFTNDEHSTKVTVEECQFIFDGSAWADYVPPVITVYDAMTLTAVNSVANTSPWAWYLKTAETDHLGSWEYSYNDLTVAINGETLDRTQFAFKYTDTNGYSVYFELRDSATLSATPAVGTTISISGSSKCYENLLGETVNDSMHGIELTETFTMAYDGTTWSLYVPPIEYTEYTGTLTTLNAAAAGNAYQMYLVGSESLAAVFASADWSDRLVPADDENSGLFLNGVKLPNNGINQGLLLKHDGANNGWFVDWDSTQSAKAGDILTIKGVFTNDEHSTKVTIEESKFEWNGAEWVDYQKPIEYTEYTGTLTTVGADAANTDNTQLYLKGSEGLADCPCDFNWTNRFAPADDANSGVFLNGVKLPNNGVNMGLLVKHNDWNGWYVNGEFAAAKGDVLVIKGLFVSDALAAKVTVEESKFEWNGTAWVDYQKPIEYTEYTGTLTTVGADAANTDNTQLYLKGSEGLADCPCDFNWTNRFAPADDANSGVFLNGVKLPNNGVNMGLLVKHNDWNGWYVNGEFAAAKGDVLVIKGLFVSDALAAKVTIEESAFEWNGAEWVDYDPTPVDYPPMTVQGINIQTTKNADGSIWFLYFDLSADLPGTAWEIINDVPVAWIQAATVGGNELGLTAKKWGENGLMVEVPVANMPAKGEKLTLLAGQYKSNVGYYGYELSEPYEAVWTGTMWVPASYLQIKPSETDVELKIDVNTGYGGDANGIFLLTTDHFPVDTTWTDRVLPTTYDGVSGIYFNGKLLEGSNLCRHGEGMAYLTLSDCGVAAKDKDKVTIKGMFILDGYAVTYKEVSFYYNGKRWMEKYEPAPPEHYTKITGESVNMVSSYRPQYKQWDVYINVDVLLPGGMDQIFFEGMKLIGTDGKEYSVVTSHSYQHSMCVRIPAEALPYGSKDGAYVTLKAGKALSPNDGATGIELTKDIRLYYYKGGISMLEPTDDTVFEEIAITRLLRTGSYIASSDEWHFYWLLDAPLENVPRETPFSGFQIEINGKAVDAIVQNDDPYLFVRISKADLPPETLTGTLHVSIGAKGYANSGRNGIVAVEEWTGIITNGILSDHEYDEVTSVETEVTGIQIVQMENSYMNVYFRTRDNVPGSVGYHGYYGLEYQYNGVSFTNNVAWKSGGPTLQSLFVITMHYNEIGDAPQDGDTITIPKGAHGLSAGHEMTITNTFTIEYKGGIWAEKVETDVKAPTNDKGIWEEFRFAEGFIPVMQENGKVLWTSDDTYHDITSVDKHKDYTFTIEAQKSYDDELVPPFYVVLRGNPVNEDEELTAHFMYGYLVQFTAQETVDPNDPNKTVWTQGVSLWKNGINDALVDQYRITYHYGRKDHPYYQYNQTYRYTFSIYNITEDKVCIEVYVNDRLALRYYDVATSDPMDPVVNEGSFLVSASCPNYLSGEPIELEQMIVEKTVCETNEKVRVAATYPSVLDGAVFTVDGEGGKVVGGVFSATKAGTYTIHCTYKGKDLGSVTITVNNPPKRDQLETNGNGSFPWLYVGIAGGAVLLIAAIVAVLLIVKKKKKANA